MANVTIPNRPALAGALREAMKEHRAGRLDTAESGYHRVLAADPGNANANHLLGLILTQSKRAKERSIPRQPGRGLPCCRAHQGRGDGA
jgi:Flp pilus assembly protein TadD